MPAFTGARSLLMSTTASLRPSLDFNFLSGALDGRITFTRASAGWSYNSAGVLTSSSTNAPRFDYDPVTLLPKGLLIEEARTNSLRNNSMTNAAAGTPGTFPTNWAAAATASGITRTVVGAGTVNGHPYIDVRYAGTAVAGDTVVFFDSTTAVAAVNATAWTSSAFLALQGGTLANVTVKQGLRYRAAAGANIGTQIYETAIVPTATLTRYERTGTGSDATIAFVVSSLTLTMASGAVDVTIRIAAPQLELGAFATSPILTTTATVTRAADNCSLPVGPWFNAAEGAVAVSCDRIGAGAFGRVFQIDDTTNDNVISAISSSAGSARVYAYIAVAGVAQVDTVAAANDVALNTAFSVGLAYRLNDCAFTLNGGTVTADASATVPTVTRLAIGAANGSSLNGHVRSLRYYSRRLGNVTLQRITT